MEHFQHAHNFDYTYYYSCDYPGCKKTITKPKRNLLLMPSGWFRTKEMDEQGEKIERHYCLKHYNEIMRRNNDGS
jgi:hypothetical protein